MSKQTWTIGLIFAARLEEERPEHVWRWPKTDSWLKPEICHLEVGFFQILFIFLAFLERSFQILIFFCYLFIFLIYLDSLKSLSVFHSYIHWFNKSLFLQTLPSLHPYMSWGTRLHCHHFHTEAKSNDYDYSLIGNFNSNRQETQM